MNTDHLYLAHHGIKGMKWGVRRFQNADGSLTSAGRQHYDVGQPREKKTSVRLNKLSNLSDEQKQTIKKAALVTGTILAAYGGYKVASITSNEILPAAKAAKKLFDEGYIYDSDGGERLRSAMEEGIQRNASARAARAAVVSAERAGRQAIIRHG